MTLSDLAIYVSAGVIIVGVVVINVSLLHTRRAMNRYTVHNTERVAIATRQVYALQGKVTALTTRVAGLEQELELRQ